MKRSPKLLGLDIGFGFTKCHDGDKAVIFPSQVNPVAGLPAPESAMPPGACRIALEGGAFIVGDDALGPEPFSAFARGPERLIRDFAKPLGLAAVAQLSQPGEPLQLVVGLPVSHVGPWGGTLADRLAGTHDARVSWTASGGDRIGIDIREIHVVPHAMGTYARLVRNTAGQLRPSAYREGKIAIIDMGFRTTDLVVVTGGRLGRRCSETLAIGFGEVFEHIASRLLDRSTPVPGMEALYRAIRLGFLHIEGQAYDLRSLRDGTCRELVAKLSDQINYRLRDEWDLEGILLTGGAGPDLAEALAPRLEGDVILIEHEQDPRLNEVHGHCSLSRQLWPGDGKIDEEKN